MSSDPIAWGVFQEVKGAWERLDASMRNALHPAMRGALALRILAVRQAEGGGFGADHRPKAAEVRKRCEESIVLAANSLGVLKLDSETGLIAPSNPLAALHVPFLWAGLVLLPRPRSAHSTSVHRPARTTF